MSVILHNWMCLEEQVSEIPGTAFINAQKLGMFTKCTKKTNSN